MSYTDQLVLTGALNDVGASVRTNVDKSYRMGVEVEGMIKISNHFSLECERHPEQKQD